jgi:O-methyltransferase involved in polyketide biosynthesis
MTKIQIHLGTVQETALYPLWARAIESQQAGPMLVDTNACLNEAMIRMELMRQSELYQSARKLLKGKARTTAFSEIRNAYRYGEYDLHSYAPLVAERSNWMAEKLDVNTQQTIATRAFKASERVLFGIKKKGKAKQGKRRWFKSNRYQKLAQKKRELERRKTAYAKSQNRRLVNEVLRHGKHIKTENVSVKGWQKRYGKAIAAKSPGFFMSELIRKAESAGGSVIKFPTQTTALSQTHLTGERIKKSLSERVHHDRTGIVMHRDLFSAYLARYVVQDKLSLQDAVNQYSGMESSLLRAWESYQQSAKRVGVAESPKSEPPAEQILSNLEKSSQIAVPVGSGRKAG